jgi:hypothetical protein
MTVDQPRPLDGSGFDWTKTITGRVTAAANTAV